LERLPTTGDHTVQSNMRDLVDAVRTPNRRQWSAAVSPWGEYSTGGFGSNAVGDGPRHLNDDGNSGTGYYRWFRTAVPTDPLAIDANEQLVRNPLDAAARRVVARAAYNADHFQLAAWHYSALVERFPEDSGVRLRLAWAERRQGNHRREIELYREVLSQHPEQPYALGGLSMALARIGELDEAHAMKDRLEVAAPTHPYTELTSGVLEATQGNELEAVECLRRAIIDREQFDRELQVELRRDISTDPALAPLRSDWRLRAMLRRHLGAAAPRRLPARSVRSR
jgi:tetratricopeptide (TPR) repeat protein